MIFQEHYTIIIITLFILLFSLLFIRLILKKKLNYFKHNNQSKKYETIVNQLHDAIITTDLNGFITTWNQGAQLLLGYTPLDILGHHIRVIYPSTSHGYLEFRLIPSLKQKGFISTEIKLKNNENELFFVHISLSMIYATNNNPIGIIANCFNISDQIIKRQALQQSEESYKSLFENSTDPNLIIKGNVFINCNNSAIKILGFKNKNKLLNTHPSSISPVIQPDGRNSFEKANVMISIAFLTGSHRFEWEHKNKNGQCFPVEVVLTAIRFKGNDILHVVWRDIKAKKQTETALAKSEAIYQTLFNRSADAILMINNGDLIECNDAAVALFGYSNKNELLSLSLFDISAKIQADGTNALTKIQEHIQTIKAKGSHKFIWHHKKADGIIFPVEISCTLIPFGNKKVIHGILRNITSKEIFYDILKTLNQQNFHQELVPFLNESLINLSRLYKCKYAFAGILQPNQLVIKTVIVLIDGKIIDNFDYCLKGTPCHDVLSNAQELITHDAANQYPDDQLLIDMNIKGYFGAPLIAKDMTKIGILVIMDTAPIQINEWTESLLGLYSKKISLKIEIDKAQQQLEHYRKLEKNNKK